MAEKTLDELLHQDLVQVLKNNEQPDEVIQKEIKDNLEEKSLVATLKQWAKMPETQEALKQMLVDSLETRKLGPNLMVVTLWMGDTEGIAAIRRVKESYEKFKKGLEEHYGKDDIGHA